MAGDYRPRQDRTGQPLAQIECTRCGLRFPTAAKTHTRCPVCGTWVRVRRTAGPPQDRRETRRKTPAVQQRKPFPVQQAAPYRPAPELRAPAPPVRKAPAIPAPSLDDDDDEVYIVDRGKLVLAAWDTAGRLIPATRLPAAYLATELAARGWYLQPHGQHVCHVVRVWPAVAEYPAASEPCTRPAEHGPLCGKCFQVLRTPAG